MNFKEIGSKKFFLLCWISCNCLLAFSQEQPMEIPSEDYEHPGRSGGLYGKVVEGQTNKGIQAAAVQVYVKKVDAVSGIQQDSLVTGMLTKANGDFSFGNISLPDSFSVKISAVGFSETTKIMTRTPVNRNLDMGNIKLAIEAKMLGEVTVVSQRPGLVMGIDRKVFNVDKNITSTGGTAIDVMRNIPSVTVDMEGNVQLRNTVPQIFVDGRPTILTLQQIPADDIERVELITNPSAKFDAASTGGIINVVLKKNKRSGFNGVASVGAGTPSILNGNLSLNLRQGKFNFFWKWKL